MARGDEVNKIKKFLLSLNQKKTNDELQAELKALTARLVIYPDYDGFMRYQKILEELYKRGDAPKIILTERKD